MSHRLVINGQAGASRPLLAQLLVSRYDNLGKGAAGAAVQNLNLMLGLPETAGLASGLASAAKTAAAPNGRAVAAATGAT